MKIFRTVENLPKARYGQTKMYVNFWNLNWESSILVIIQGRFHAAEERVPLTDPFSPFKSNAGADKYFPFYKYE